MTHVQLGNLDTIVIDAKIVIYHTSCIPLIVVIYYPPIGTIIDAKTPRYLVTYMLMFINLVMFTLCNIPPIGMGLKCNIGFYGS